MNEILVYTQQDCDDLCRVLCRSGYVVTAAQIATSVCSTICPKQWRVTYYEPKDVVIEDSKEIKCWKCGKVLTDKNRSNIVYTTFPPKYTCKECN